MSKTETTNEAPARDIFNQDGAVFQVQHSNGKFILHLLFDNLVQYAQLAPREFPSREGCVKYASD